MLSLKIFSVVLVALIILISAALQKLGELSELDLTGTVLINLLDKFLDIDGHFKLFFDGLNKLCSIDSTVTVRFSTHSNKCVQEILFTRAAFVFSFFVDKVFELSELDPASVFRVRHCDHPVGEVFGNHLSGLLESSPQIVYGDGA